MLNVQTLLGRADESALTLLLGRETVRLLQRMDPALVIPSNLRVLIRQTQAEVELLRDVQKRRILVDLMYPDEALAVAVKLGLDGEDPYDSIATTSIRKGSQIEAALFRYLQVEAPEEHVYPSQSRLKHVCPHYALFKHQREAVDACMEHLEGPGRRRVLLHMPTGAGKTRTAMHVVSRYLLHNEGSSVIWLANSEELCEQAAQEFEKAWSCLGTRELGIARFWGGFSLDKQAQQEGVVVAGLAKMYACLQQDPYLLQDLADRAGLIVFDEAHQAVAPTYQMILELLLSRRTDARLLGLSATPGRSWDEIYKDELLANFFDRKKVSLQIEGYASPIDYLVEVGYLAQPVFRDLLYEGGPEITERDLQALSNSLDLSRSLLDQLGADEQRNLLIVTAVQDLATRHRRIIVFAPSVDSANILATVIHARGIRADTVTAQTNADQRQAILSNYLSSSLETRVVINFGVLTTGFDAPQTSAAVIARPTNSLVLYSQMAGRALRGALVGGNSSAEIVTIVDTSLPGFRAPAEMFMNWEDVW